MGNLNGFNAAEVEPGNFDVLPAGNYTAMIDLSELRPTKDGRGQYLYLELLIVEGQYEGRRLFDRLNLENPSEKAVEIAKRTLSSICRAVGVMTPKDSSELHDRPLMVRVVVKPASDQYAASNEIKGYAPREQATPATPAVPASSKPPWARK